MSTQSGNIEVRYQTLLLMWNETGTSMRDAGSYPSEERWNDLDRIECRLSVLSLCRRLGYVPPFFERDI